MTCPFFSERNGKPRCNQYGELSEAKAREECQANYLKCYDTARGELINKMRRQSPPGSDAGISLTIRGSQEPERRFRDSQRPSRIE